MIQTLIAYGFRLTDLNDQFKSELPDGIVKVFSALDRLSWGGVLNEDLHPELMNAVRSKVNLSALSEFPMVAPPGDVAHPIVLGFEVEEDLLDSVIAVDGYRDRWDLLVAGFPEPLRAQILVSAGVDRPRIHVLAWDDGNF